MTPRLSRFLPCLLLPLLAGPTVRAQQLYTYNGPFTGSGGGFNPWSTDNWIGPTATPVSSATTQLLFPSADLGIYTATNDLGNPFLLNGAFLNSFSQINTTINSGAGNGFQLTGANPFLSVGGPGTFTFAGGGNGLVLAPTSGTTTITGPGNGTLALGSNAAVISGVGGITVNLTGNGATTLFGANTFTGGVTVNAGTLAIGSAGSLGTGALTINGGSLRTTGVQTIANPVALNADLRFTTGSLTFNGPVSGAGGLVSLNGQNFNSQSLTFNAPLSFTGPITIQNSIPRPNGSSGNLGAVTLNAGASVASAQPVTVGNNGTLQVFGSGINTHFTQANPVVFTGGRIAFVGTAGAAYGETFGNVTASGLNTVILGAAATTNTLAFGAYNRQGNSTLLVRGPFNGSTNTLTFAGGLPGLSDPQAPGGATTGQYTSVVPFATGVTDPNSVVGTSFVHYDSRGVTYIAPTDTTQVQQVAANGTLDANTASKNVNIAGGSGVTIIGSQRVNSLAVSSSGTITGGGTVTVASGAVLLNGGPVPVIFSGPTLDFGANPGYLHLNGTAVIQNGSSLTGSAGVVISGANLPGSALGDYTIQFSSNTANPFQGGLTVAGNAGVNFTLESQLGASKGPVTLDGGGLNFNPAGPATLATSRALTLAAAGGNLNALVNNTLTWAGPISGPGALLIGSSASAISGTVALTGANTYAGPTYVYTGATLAVSSDANLGSPSAPLALTGGTVQFTASNTFARPITITGFSTLDTGTNTVTLAGSITGVVPGGIAKIGTGTLTLAGSSPLFAGRFQVGTAAVNGGAAVPGGTLLFAGGSLPQVTTLTVNAAGTVAGTGSVGGSISVLAGGTFSPGTVASPGRLSVGASLLLPSGTATVLDLQGTTAATGYSQAVVGGALTLGGNLSVNLLAGYNPTLGAKFYVFDLTGLTAANGAFAGGSGPGGTLFADQAGNTYQINYADRDPADTSNALNNDVSLTVVGVTAGVPEPSTLALLGLGAGAVAFAARRRFNRR